MSGGIVKKNARNKLDSFKKHYAEVCKNEKLNLPESMDRLDSYWIGQLIDRDIKREIIRMVGKESLDLKLIFNFMPSFRTPIPQKEWFLGDAHSIQLLARQPSNTPVFSISTLRDGVLEQTKHMHFALKAETSLAMFNFAISNTCVVVNVLPENKHYRVNGKIDGHGKLQATVLYDETEWLTKEEANTLREYEPKREHHWRGRVLILLNSGEIMCPESKVTVFLNDRKIDTQRIWQMDIYEDIVVLLFESYFMARGTIRASKAGILMDCCEIAGTYPTSLFALSPDFRLLVRKSVFVTKIPPTKFVFNSMQFRQKLEILENHHKKNSMWFIHNDCKQIHSVMGTDFDDRRRAFVNVFCRDIQLFFKGLENEVQPEDYRLSTKEKFIVGSRKGDNEVFFCELNKADGCASMDKILAFARKQIDEFDPTEELDPYMGVALNALAEMIGFFATFFVSIKKDTYFYPSWQNDVMLIERTWELHQTNFHRLIYYPLELYEKNNTRLALGVETECVGLIRYKPEDFINGHRKIAKVLFARPDVLFFGNSITRPPVAFLQKFAQVYTKQIEEKDDTMNNLVLELADWNFKEDEPSTSGTAPKPSTSAKPKKPSK